jgi:hypothetical protein
MPTSPIPSTGSLVDWLRSEAQRPFQEPRGDEGDQIALQWLQPLVDRDPRIAAAVVELLGEGDRMVTTRLLQLAAAPDATASLRGAVARAIAKHHQTLAAVQCSSDQTALGLAVYAMWPPPPLADDTLAALHDVQKPEDGWPLSVRTGIVTDLPRFSDRLVGDFARMTDREQRNVLLEVFARASEQTLLDMFAQLASEADAALIARVAQATKATLDDLDEARRFAAARGTHLTGDDGATRWARYAAALGVQP